MPTQLSGNGIYSWWTHPIAQKLGSDLYFTAVNSSGLWRVYRNDLNDYVTLGTGNGDDHNAPSVIAEAGKDIIAFYTQHGLTDTVRYKKCATWPTFGSEQSITFPFAVSYSQTITDAQNDTIYLFTRSSSKQWYVTKSEDWGDTWSTPILFFESSVTQSRMYCLIQPSESEPGVFHLAATGHPGPSTTWKTIRYGKIDISTGDISTSGGLAIANLDGTSLPLNEYSLEEAWTPSGTYRVRLLDVGDKEGQSIVLYARWADDAPTPRYYYAVRDDSTGVWTHTYLASSGGVYGDPVRQYVPGTCLDRNGNNWIYLGRQLSGVYRMERFELTSSLALDTITTIMTDSDEWLARPYAIRGDDNLLFIKLVTYNDFDDYKGHIYKG